MAKKRNSSGNDAQQTTNRFDGSQISDVNDFHLEPNNWVYARNFVKNSNIGDLGEGGNEPSNVICKYAPYTVIGIIHLTEDRWLVFSTNDIDSEIGEFIEGTCEYTKLVNDTCLNFNRANLIIGVSRSTFDCSYRAYWDDGRRNPSRTLDIGNIPWVQECTTTDGCTSCVDTDVLDCDKIRLETFIETPCLKIKKGPSAGSILNGSYYVQIAYGVNNQRVTDYFSMSNVLSLFDHGNVNSSIEINIENLDENFDEYELVLISTIAEKTVAKSFGFYGTSQKTVIIDYVEQTLTSVPLNDLAIMTPIAESTKAMYNIGKYLLRTSPKYKLDFNYQPIANQIQSFWQVVEYPVNYYKNGGTNIGHMRDEVYPYFIKWLYNTGDKSKSYHIPGRAETIYDVPDNAGALIASLPETDDVPPALINTVNDIDTPDGLTPKVFEMFNTAFVTASDEVNGLTILEDGGKVIAEGKMGYHESSELYDDKNPIVWNSNLPGEPQFDLCGKPIRHHKFPDNIIISAGGGTTDLTNHYKQGGQFIRVLGIRFDNIQPPLDNNGAPIQGIIGYEILRGSRNGNKTVLYKGMINNMFEYDLPNQLTSKTGLYANYPFNDLRPDKYISKTEVSWESVSYDNYNPNDVYSKKHFTFHSPDTMFAKPFLIEQELKIYETLYGTAQGFFSEVDNHPKHKFITDVTFYASIVVGIGYAIAKQKGTKEITYPGWTMNSQAPFLGTSNSFGNIGWAVAAASAGSSSELVDLADGVLSSIDVIFGTGTSGISKEALAQALSILAAPPNGLSVSAPYESYIDVDQTPDIFKVLTNIPIFSNNLAEGSDTFMNLVKAMGKYRQFAHQYQAVCKYENSYRPQYNNRRRKIDFARYLNRGIQEFNDTHIVNHLLRNESVIFNTTNNVENPGVEDISRPTLLSEIKEDERFNELATIGSSHYVAFKNRLRNQYGKINTVRQLPMHHCYIDISNSNSGTLFGGDTYIGKYSEKNTFYYFNKWLQGQANGAEIDYRKQYMVNYPSFWMDTEPFDLGEFMASIPEAIEEAINDNTLSDFFETLVTPSDKNCFDRQGIKGLFLVKEVFMYLFNSGVRDFFVESEINIDCRDWEDTDARKHYPVLSDLREMFNSAIIKADNYYKIDRSLSNANLPYSKISWGSVQDLDYNPSVAETCYVLRNKRMLYSLPQQRESKKDNWSSFLANNYKDYSSEITAVKPINKTGGLIIFRNEAPMELPGVDELQTATGVKITIGDGGLLARDAQSLSNAERSIEYGSCQNRLSVINTPAGLFWMNVNQGRIFSFAGGLKEISVKDNKYWFNKYLPYQLLKDFPDFDLLDNPVYGIGCQTIYDNEYGIVYFCKKDYRLKPNLPVSVSYVGEGRFLIDGIVTVPLGDPLYFDNCSWTYSYDPYTDDFLSFHDWHPDLSLSGINHFVTVKRNGFWRHNSVCNSYCNFYGVDYPFEIEFQSDTTPTVTTLKSLEYYLQGYRYAANCYDRFHVLNHNFDEAIIYNSEQCSGRLLLNHAPENNPFELNRYPVINFNSIDILYSKEEQKYRFNQFWDIVNNRQNGDFIWLTEDNGYIKTLNPQNLNYNKNQFERKPFRHYNNRILLIKRISGDIKILVSLSNVKVQQSPR
jgi:hypothetical protein